MRFRVLQLEPPVVFTHSTVTALRRTLYSAFASDQGERKAPGLGLDEETTTYDVKQPVRGGAVAIPINSQGSGLDSEARDTFEGLVSAEQVQSLSRRALTAIALCHNVTPIIESDGSRQLQAASPDEVCTE